jgi:hypothetical protein
VSAAKPKRVKVKLLVTLEVEVEGWWPADLDAARARLLEQTDSQFPFLNGSMLGADGSYSTKCLGVRKVLWQTARPK